jgi:purine-binding chemotaxis protein CheW
VADRAGADEAEQAPAQELELLSFRMGGEEYAVTVDDVREVLKLRDLTPVPNTPGYILGVTSLRGIMLPVIDLCKRLGLTPGVRDDKSRIIVVNPAEEDVGLMVDRVTGVLRIMPDAIKPAPENVEQGAEFLRGIVRRDDKLYILLDLEKAVGLNLHAG